MADADLRDLERRFHASGSVEDEAAWLKARVQAGELSEEQLRFAACLGNSGSEFVTGITAQLVSLHWPASDEFSDRQKRLAAASAEIASHGKVASARAAVAAVHLVANKAIGGGYLVDAGPKQTLLSAIEDWILAPSFENQRCVGRLAKKMQFPTTVGRVFDAAAALVAAPVESFALHDPLSAAGWDQDPHKVIGVVREELIPWALGYADPVRERVAARQRESSAT